MRILFHHRIASRDGQAVHLEELIRALQRLGHETILVGPPSLATSRFGGSDPWVDRIKRSIPAALYELLEVAYNFKAFLRLRAATRAYRPDVIYERFSLFLFAGIWVSHLYEVPMLLEVNAPLLEERVQNDGLRLHRLGRWAQRLLWNRADHVLPVTHVLARAIEEYGVKPADITVIPNGVNPERFSTISDTDAAKASLQLSSRTVIGFTGFIRSWNEVHRLIDFVAQYSVHLDVHILVLGDGPARGFLERHARARGVSDRLTITGVLERDDVARHIAAFDVAAVPSVTSYASPLKLFEYAQLGRAIVAPDAENIREILTDGEDALLFDPTGDGALEAALFRLCSDATLRSRLGDSARHTITKKSLTWDYNAKRVVGIAQAIISRAAEVRPVDVTPNRINVRQQTKG